MSDTVVIAGFALISAAFATASPIILSALTNTNTRRMREQDWERQDEVARKAADAADALLEANKTTNSKLEVIHTLVNSNMTAAMQAELDATERELALMKSVVELHRVAGKAPDGGALEAITRTEIIVQELRAKMADRLKAQDLATAQQHAAAASSGEIMYVVPAVTPTTDSDPEKKG